MAGTPGKRLMPKLIDHMAEAEPDRMWALSPVPNSNEYETITFGTFANAINRCARWVANTVQAPERTVVAYIGESDLRYYLFFIAIVKAGYTPLFTSHLNSEAANTSLFESTGCQILLCGFPTPDLVAVNKQTVKIYQAPSQEETWNPFPVDPFPFEATYEEAFNWPLVIIHTSGSSGLPKPITYTHGSFSWTDNLHTVPDFEGHPTEIQMRTQIKRYFLGLPPFHGAGFLNGLQTSVFMGLPIVFPAANQALSAKALIHAIDYANVDGAALLPHTIQDVAKSPEALSRLHKLRFIAWVGGPIPQAAGDSISARTALFNSYASTEHGSTSTLVKKAAEDWQYYFFHPTANSFDFRLVPGQTELYELFVLRDDRLQQQVFRIFPHLQEWPMKDLFSKHPTLAHHWRHEGRSDDLVVFKNGVKLNPRGIEVAIRAALPDRVADAIIFGTGRMRPGVLVEPVETKQHGTTTGDGKENPSSDILDAVWAVLQAEKGAKTEGPGAFVRGLITMTTPDKPFPRSGKRTAQRGLTLELYKQQIDELYEALPSELQRDQDFRIGSE